MMIASFGTTLTSVAVSFIALVIVVLGCNSVLSSLPTTLIPSAVNDTSKRGFP